MDYLVSLQFYFEILEFQFALQLHWHYSYSYIKSVLHNTDSSSVLSVLNWASERAVLKNETDTWTAAPAPALNLTPVRIFHCALFCFFCSSCRSHKEQGTRLWNLSHLIRSGSVYQALPISLTLKLCRCADLSLVVMVCLYVFKAWVHLCPSSAPLFFKNQSYSKQLWWP